MELRQLRYVVKVAAAGSVSRASQALHIVQPALSAQISQLEEELGQPLFLRSHQGMALTRAGRVFLSHAQRILREIDGLPAALEARDAEAAGTVSIGFPQYSAPQFAVPLIAALRSRHPRVVPEVFDGLSFDMPARLRAGELDLALLWDEDEARGLHGVAAGREDYFLVSRADLAPATTSVTAAQLAALPLALPAAPHGVRQLLEAFCASRGHPLPRTAITANSVSVLRRCVEEGWAHTVMPVGPVLGDVRAGRMSALPLLPALSRPLYLCAAPGTPLSPAAAVVHGLLLDLADTPAGSLKAASA